MRALLELSGVSMSTPGGRPLFEGLELVVGRERVALVGRNGAGKTTLLSVLAGSTLATEGRVRTGGAVALVPQILETQETAAGASKGERRRAALERALSSGAEILLLDEPTEDLDGVAVAWLRERLSRWEHCLVVASHDRRLLSDFSEFFVVSETGCRHLRGTLPDVECALEREHAATELRYARSLARQSAKEEQTEHVARRRDRKKRRGRCSELDRATPRIRLNAKRGAAQVYQGKMAQRRQARLDAVRQWTRAARRALTVRLPLDVPVPELPASEAPVLSARGLAAHARGRVLFDSLDLEMGRRRVAIVGPNGAGKTTLIETLIGSRLPSAGAVRVDASRVGAIRQAGVDWMRDESLLQVLTEGGGTAGLQEAAAVLVASRFPLALAERPLRSLSPGERARAALIALFRRRPAVELLVLDEPTFSLDLVGQRALAGALRAWPGGLVVASHDHDFLRGIGVDDWIRLPGAASAGTSFVGR